MITKKTGLIAALVVIFLAGGGYFAFSGGAGIWAGEEDQAPPAKGQGLNNELALVDVKEIEKGNVAKVVTLSGRVNTSEQRALVPQAAGEIDSIHVEEGDRVEGGETLISLDDDDLYLQLQEAQSAREAARAQLEEAKAGLDVEVTEAETSLEMAKKNKEQMEKEVERLESQHEEGIFSGQEISQARLRYEEAKSSYENAKDQKEQARKEYERMKELYEADHVAGQDFEQVEVQYNQAVSSYETAKENKEIAEEDLERAKWLDDEGFVSDRDVEQAKLEYENAKEQVKTAEAVIQSIEEGTQEERINALKAQLSQADVGVSLARRALDNATVEAPVGGGTIASIEVERGELLDGASPAMMLIDSESMAVEASLPETYINSVNPGQDVTVNIPSSEDGPYEKTVNKISEVPAEGGSNYKLEVLVQNENDLLRTGMFSEVDVAMEEKENVLTIPRHALVEEEDDMGVYVIVKREVEIEAEEEDEKEEAGKEKIDEPGEKEEPGEPGEDEEPREKEEEKALEKIIEFREVETGVSENGVLEVKNGLEEGELIVTAGHGDVLPGDVVEVNFEDEGGDK